jgi:hypothetical protein
MKAVKKRARTVRAQAFRAAAALASASMATYVLTLAAVMKKIHFEHLTLSR